MTTALILNNDRMGNGVEELTSLLIKNYLKILYNEQYKLNFVCLYANGVKLVCEDSPVLDELKALQDKGVKLLVCKTCLNYYKLADKLKVGTAGSMVDIIDVQFQVDKVITI